ncbi:xylosidase [Mucilaginibacter limnophilus]|uniref:Xylosidase n=1 Tax=Mucilaginibacter limnophilus TaxID=1932778 RepID=A0A3S2WYB5_9SPHI|nr:glycoside hydrolase family 71/99-like protein [Mucilaginibacter limnophilus]RVU00960.1 xylosidase [Mucilaginibacter limnophilus]
MRRLSILYGILLLIVFTACSKKSNPKPPKDDDDPVVVVPETPEESPVGDVVGKITVGYQGWFTAAGDGSPQNNWGHQNIESWPDVSEYATTYQTTLPDLENGQPAKMFSSWDASTVNKHFEWMKQYNIDCAALQRFCNEITPGSDIKAFRDGMATKVKNAAEANGVKFYIMYDASGWKNLEVMKADWENTITGSLDLLSSPQYAKQNGKPVVSIYGLGYAHHPGNAAEALDLINWFKAKGCYVIGSVAGQWRTGTGDSQPNFINTYKAFNMISGWAVGRVVDGNYGSWVNGDRDFCKANGIDYQPCAYPGTSFHNTNGDASPKNQFPRRHGDFLWSQFAVFKNSGVRSVYVAMFDEVNEATQIFKTAENTSQIPAGKWFLTLDADGVAVSSDFYLRLVSDGGKMIKGQLPYSASHPTPHIE